MPRFSHMLSFDVEEYFHVEAAARSVTPQQWESFETRLPPCIERILTLLESHQAGATFFVLGWVARRQGQLVKRIAAAGHEIASHGMSHQMLGRLGPEVFRRELDDSRKLLEDLTGRAVKGFRAPTFSITLATAWALDVLAEAGFAYDSSIFPVRHDRYGIPDAPRLPHLAVGPGGGSILEIPPMTIRLAGHNLPVGGGGYLRLLPVGLIGHVLRQWQGRGQSAMLYLHPWELDPDQPVLAMGLLARRRHRLGLSRTQAKLRWLLERFRFTGVRDLAGVLEQCKLVKYVYTSHGGHAEGRKRPAGLRD